MDHILIASHKSNHLTAINNVITETKYHIQVALNTSRKTVVSRRQPNGMEWNTNKSKLVTAKRLIIKCGFLSLFNAKMCVFFFFVLFSTAKRHTAPNCTRLLLYFLCVLNRILCKPKNWFNCFKQSMSRSIYCIALLGMAIPDSFKNSKLKTIRCYTIAWCEFGGFFFQNIFSCLCAPNERYTVLTDHWTNRLIHWLCHSHSFIVNSFFFLCLSIFGSHFIVAEPFVLCCFFCSAQFMWKQNQKKKKRKNEKR